MKATAKISSATAAWSKAKSRAVQSQPNDDSREEILKRDDEYASSINTGNDENGWNDIAQITKPIAADRLAALDPPLMQVTAASFSAAQAKLLAGLRRTPKAISPVWLYDEMGSRLFDVICDLPEYYLTRTEMEIMQTHAADMAKAIGPYAALIEFGSGTSVKTRLLLDRMESPSVYVPIDIAELHLLEAAGTIAREYPLLSVAPVCADFTKPVILPARARLCDRRVVYFPGSTIGNFDPTEVRSLLESMRDLVGFNGAVLIGIDLKKDVSTILHAYDDSAGITARFNLNALRHINRMFHGNFPLEAFEHQAVWCDSEGRVEMRLLCDRDVEVSLSGEKISIKRDEYIRTESCYKYTVEEFGRIAHLAGLQVQRQWFDAQKRFAVLLLDPSPGAGSRAQIPEDVTDTHWFARELSSFKSTFRYLTA